MSDMGFDYHRDQFFPGCKHLGVLQGHSAAGVAWGECLECGKEKPWHQIFKYNERLRQLALAKQFAEDQEKQPEPALD